MAQNHKLAFRPLRGGIEVFQPVVNRPGTIGCIATRDGADRWIVSCYHVLCRVDFSTFADGEPVFQPFEASENLIGNVVSGVASAGLDVAAARVVSGVECLPLILGLPELRTPELPEEGMLVTKSGAVTGITEGVITRVSGGAPIRIERRDGYPRDYVLTEHGDSGAVWVNQKTGSPIALNTGGSESGDTAFAVPMNRVLIALGLTLLLPAGTIAAGSS